MSLSEIIKYFVKVIKELCGKYFFRILRSDWKETDRPVIRLGHCVIGRILGSIPFVAVAYITT